MVVEVTLYHQVFSNVIAGYGLEVILVCALGIAYPHF